MTDEKSEPACRWCREPAERHLGKLKLCPAGGALSFHAFTPAKPEAKEATDADFELRATCPHGFSYIEDCDRCPWSPGAKEVEPTDRAWMRAAIKTLQSDRDAAIERAEKAEADAREFGGNAYRRLEARAENAENRNVNLQRCHCGQHSMERPDIHSINWYWSKHTREACTLELPNVRCWCGRLRSEHIDGHAAPVTPPAVDPRDARIAELETMLASTRKTWNEQVQELEIDRDQQRARADAAEARCRELESRDAPWHPFPRGTWSGVTDAKEKNK